MKDETLLWQAYLNNIHKEEGIEEDTTTTKKFWKEYETLIEAGKDIYLPEPESNVIDKVTKSPPTQQSYATVFLKYWNGQTTSFTIYLQKTKLSQQKKLAESTTLSKDSLEIIVMFILFLGMSVLMAILISLLISIISKEGILFIFLVTPIVFFLNISRLIDWSIAVFMNTKVGNVQNHSIECYYEVYENHLIFSKNIKHKNVVRLRLDYEDIKSFTRQNSELCIRSLHGNSRQHRTIIKNFSVPLDNHEGNQLADFLREVLWLNKVSGKR